MEKTQNVREPAVMFGGVNLSLGLMLAPLAGVSDHVFRRICRRFGAEYTVSEMISAKSLCYEKKSHRTCVGENSRTAPLAAVYADDVPMAVQLFGCEPEFMAEAAVMVEEGNYAGCRSQTSPAAIDINMGCPVPKIVGNGEGSALMRDPVLAGEIVRAVCRAVHLPVTVKIRTGWDDEHINAVELAKRLEDSGAAMICVHGRTRQQMYRPGVDIETIARVKVAVRIPVVGNGGIMCAEDALEMRRRTGVDGWMIARGAMGNPWLFSEIRAALTGNPYSPPTWKERVEVAMEQMWDRIAEKGERSGFAESKKQISWFIHGARGSAEVRGRLMTAASPQEAEAILQEFLERCPMENDGDLSQTPEKSATCHDVLDLY